MYILLDFCAKLLSSDLYVNILSTIFTNFEIPGSVYLSSSCAIMLCGGVSVAERIGGLWVREKEVSFVTALFICQKFEGHEVKMSEYRGSLTEVIYR